MKQITTSMLAILLLASQAIAQVNDLPRSTPEREGVPSSAISALLDSLFAIPQTDIHSVMMLRHGKVIAEVYPEPFKAEYQHTLYSCSKTFVSTAVGLAIDANLLRVTDRVATFFPVDVVLFKFFLEFGFDGAHVREPHIESFHFGKHSSAHAAFGAAQNHDVFS